MTLEEVLIRGNMKKAYHRVVKNKGSAGVDGVTTEELGTLVKARWHIIKSSILSGSYRPDPVLEVEIDKPEGGKRKLGIPTVLDRMIQQAIHQVLNPVSYTHLTLPTTPYV